jgi:hypothetical protein
MLLKESYMKKVVQPKKKVQPKKVDNTPRVDKMIREPGKYEITKDDFFIIKFGLVESDGRWLIAKDSEGEGIDTCWVKFRMWTFEEEATLRHQATQWDAQKRVHNLNNDFYNRLKVQKLLMDWSFAEVNENLRIHRINNTLTDESWNAFIRLQRNICVYVIENMNRVLEYNG